MKTGWWDECINEQDGRMDEYIDDSLDKINVSHNSHLSVLADDMGIISS